MISREAPGARVQAEGPPGADGIAAAHVLAPEPGAGPANRPQSASIAHLMDFVIFAKLVEARSFSLAARRLEISKATVSKRMRALERTMGARLLERSTRRMTLTGAGSALYPLCARVLADAEAAGSALAGTDSADTLRLATTVSFGVRYLLAAVVTFTTLHPSVAIHVSLTDQAVSVGDGGFDIALRVGEDPGGDLAQRRLMSCPMVICAAPDYLAFRGVPAGPHDLPRHDCLVQGSAAWRATWRLRWRGEEVAVPVSGSFDADNGETVRTLALAGHGLALMPRFLIESDLKSGRLVTVLADAVLPDAGVYALYPLGTHARSAVHSFVDFLANRLSPDPAAGATCGDGLADPVRPVT